jgi:hypothetical protein
MPGGRKCVGMSPTTFPPRARRIALRSNPATTARRTLTSSNGLIVVFIEMYRMLSAGTSTIWSFFDVTASRMIAGGGEKSPLSMCEPSRMRRDETLVSSLPWGMSISSR